MRERRHVLFGAVLAFLPATAAALAVPVDPNGTFVDDDTSVHEADIEATAAEGITSGCNPPDNDMLTRVRR